MLVVLRALGNLNAYQCINTRSVYCRTDSYYTSQKELCLWYVPNITTLRSL